MHFGVLADLILLIHVLWVGVVVLTVPLVLAGGALDWRWVRNRVFRTVHLVMIAIVVGESLLGIACPLTVWEHQARHAAGGDGVQDGSFVGYWLRRLIFFDLPEWVFTTVYVVFGVLILSLWRLVPPTGKSPLRTTPPTRPRP